MFRLVLLFVFLSRVWAIEPQIPFQKGMTYAGGRWCPEVRLDSALSDRSLEDLSTTGANWIALVVTDFELSINTTDIFPVPEGSNTDIEIEHAVLKAHELGLKVMLKLHIDTLYSFGGNWRGDIGVHFSDDKWKSWFNNYIPFAVFYAKLAQRYSIEQIALGTELIASDIHDAHWRIVVSEIRKYFNGSLTYACNFWGDNVFGSSYSCFNVTWWDVLDIIGIDAYFPMAPTKEFPSYDDIAVSWDPIIENLNQLSRKYNKPIIFTEIGYTSQKGGNREPNHWNIENPTNYTIQSACYQAFFEKMMVPDFDWFRGAFWWAWWSDPMAGTDYTNLYTPQHKPVQDVLRKYYAGGASREFNGSSPFWCGVTQA